MDGYTIAAIVMAGVGIIGLLFQHFGVLSGIKERLTSLETKMELFWTAIQSRTIDILKSSSNPRKDALLDKLQDGCCTNNECHELFDILTAELEEKELDDGKRLAYCMVLGLINQRLFDLEKGRSR